MFLKSSGCWSRQDVKDTALNFGDFDNASDILSRSHGCANTTTLC